MTTGYSSKPLAAKLGIRPDQTVLAVAAPENYAALLGELPPGAKIVRTRKPPYGFIHAFATSVAELEAVFAELRPGLEDAGVLWVSWPKKSSKVPTDLDENVVRGIGLAHRLVDVKVAAVDERWSALKFVVRVRDRA